MIGGVIINSFEVRPCRPYRFVVSYVGSRCGGRKAKLHSVGDAHRLGVF